MLIMIKGQASRTALLTAVQRAHHYLTAPEPKILRDDVALSLTGLKTLDDVQGYIDNMVQAFSALSYPETAAIFMKRIDGAVCMRSRVVEEKLASAKTRGVKQLVILGAGLDSTAYRCLDLMQGLQVFEVDHPSTQAWKREQLSAAHIKIPENVTYVAFDFENQTLAEALLVGGVSSNLPTFFTWLGVQMYLTPEAVTSTLAVMGGFPKGSEMVMDFISPNYVKVGGVSENSVEHLSEVVMKMGEPIRSKFSEEHLEDILKTSGFSRVNFLTARWLIDNYLNGVQAAFDMPDKATSILWAQI